MIRQLFCGEEIVVVTASQPGNEYPGRFYGSHLRNNSPMIFLFFRHDDTMKKRIIAFLFFSVCSGTSYSAVIYKKDGNSLDLYGRMNGLMYSSRNSAKEGDHSFVRFGFKGNAMLSRHMEGYGRLEVQKNTNQPESVDKSQTRLGYAGLRTASWNTLDYGRNTGVLFDIGNWTNGRWTGILPGMGIDTYESQDNFMAKRSNNLLTFRSRNISGLVSGLDIAMQFQGRNGGWNDTEHVTPESNNPRGVAHQNGNGYGVSAIYRFDNGLSLGGAGMDAQRTREQKQDGHGDRAKAWTAGIKYDRNHYYLAADYAVTKDMTWFKNHFADRTDNTEMVAQYHFRNGLRPLLVWSQSRESIHGHKRDMIRFIDAGVDYLLNKNMMVYLDYKINLIHNDNSYNADSDDVMAAGIMYHF